MSPFPYLSPENRGEGSKKFPAEFLFLGNFCEKWCQYALQETLRPLFSVDITFLGIRFAILNRSSGAASEVEHCYPLTLFEGVEALAAVDSEVFYLELLYKGSTQKRTLLIPGVSQFIDVPENKNKEKTKKIINIFYLP